MLHRLEKMIQIISRLKGPLFKSYITKVRVLVLGRSLNPEMPYRPQDKWIQFKSRCFTKQRFRRLWEYIAHDVKLCLSPFARKGHEWMLLTNYIHIQMLLLLSHL